MVNEKDVDLTFQAVTHVLYMHAQEIRPTFNSNRILARSAELSLQGNACKHRHYAFRICLTRGKVLDS